MKLNLTQGGKQLSPDELSALLPLDVQGEQAGADHLKAMDKIHAWVCVRERTRKECYERLVDLEFDKGTAAHAIDRAVECGLIDESRYASAYIKGKVRAGWGRGRIVRKLEENGIPGSVIDECSEFFATPQEEYERALREVEKRPARSKNPKATYVRRLLQKGYSQDIALRAVNDFLYGSKESCA